MAESETDLPRLEEPPMAEGAYLVIYRKHLKETQSHITGKDISARLAPSLGHPLGHWTASEKEAFFHALAVHSRLRPDLIAESIGPTKTALDVCMYLDMLHHSSIRDVRDDTRSKHPIASELSDEWLEYEERNAGLLIEDEDEWAETNVYLSRKNELRRHKRMLRQVAKANAALAEEKEKESSPSGPGESSEEEDKTKSEEQPDIESWKQEIREWAESRQPWWKKEDALRSLSSAHLRVFDWIIRDDLKDSASASKPPLRITQPNTLPNESSSSLPTIPQHASTSSASAPIPTTDTHIPKEEEQEINLDILSPLSKRLHQKRMWARKKRAQKLGKSEADISAVVGRLKPGRKTNKKAQQRAERRASRAARERDEEGEGTVELAQLHQPNVSVQPQAVEFDVSQDAQGVEAVPRRVGISVVYRTAKLFKDTELDIAALRRPGLDLFNHQKIYKIMNLYDRTYSTVHDAPLSIAFDTLVLLRAHLAEYITRVMHRAIAIREYENIAKSRTKVWRVSDAVTGGDVQQAVRSIGREATREQTLGVLADELRKRENIMEEDVPIGDTRQVPGDDGDEDEIEPDNENDNDRGSGFVGSDEPLLPPIHRDIHGSYIHHPSAVHSGIWSQRQRPHPHRVHHSFSISTPDAMGEDVLMDIDSREEDSETMDTILQRELDEEAELDELDTLQEKAAQRELWRLVEEGHAGKVFESEDEEDRWAREMGVGSGQEEDGDGDEKDRGKKVRAAKKREKDLQRGYKSDAYILDSDID